MKISEVMEPHVVTVVENDSASVACEIMLRRGIRHLPVVRQGRVVGVVSQSDLLAHMSEAEGVERPGPTVREMMSSPAQTVHVSAPLADAAAQMAVHKTGCLPVENEGQLVGIVTTTDLLSNLAQYQVPGPAPSDLDASAIMSTNPHAIMPDGRVLDAVATMVRHGVRHLVVVDGLRRVVGMLSDRDIYTAVGRPRAALEDAAVPDTLADMKVSAVMTPEPRTVPIEATLASLVGALLADRFGALPVVDQADRLVGIVSYIDVLHYVRRRADYFE